MSLIGSFCTTVISLHLGAVHGYTMYQFLKTNAYQTSPWGLH